MQEFTPEKIQQQEHSEQSLEGVIKNIADDLTAMRAELANFQNKKLDYMTPKEAAHVLAEVDPQIKIREREIVRLERVLAQLKNVRTRTSEVLSKRFDVAANDGKDGNAKHQHSA